MDWSLGGVFLNRMVDSVPRLISDCSTAKHHQKLKPIRNLIFGTVIYIHAFNSVVSKKGHWLLISTKEISISEVHVYIIF